MKAKCLHCLDFDALSPFSVCLFFYISKILGSIAKGCPLLEYIDLHVICRENLLHIDVLIALASLRRLRSVFIHMFVGSKSESISPAERKGFRVSLDAIVEQGFLEVRIRLMTMRKEHIHICISDKNKKHLELLLAQQLR